MWLCVGVGLAVVLCGLVGCWVGVCGGWVDGRASGECVGGIVWWVGVSFVWRGGGCVGSVWGGVGWCVACARGRPSASGAVPGGSVGASSRTDWCRVGKQARATVCRSCAGVVWVGARCLSAGMRCLEPICDETSVVTCATIGSCPFEKNGEL